MKAKFKNMLVQVLSLILVITLAIPSQVFAASSTRKKANTYDSSRSIMGLATSAATNPSVSLENNSKKTVYTSEITSEETDLYQVDKSARVDTETGKITYRIAVIDKNPVDTYPADGLETLSTSFAVNANANHKDIQVDKVVGLDPAGKEVDFASKISRPNIFENNDNIETLAIKSDKPQYGLVYYLSSSLDDLAKEYFTKDEVAREKSPIFSIDMAIKNQDGKSIYLDRYSLRPNENTETEIQIDEAGNIIEEADLLALADDDKSKLVDGRYIEESKSIISHTPATIQWQDFIFPENDQSFRYDIKVDDKQDTTHSEIKVEFYEARDNGFVINNSFTQNFPFADYLDIKIPEGQFVRLSFQTTLATDKKVQTYSYNGKEIKNPAYDPAGTDQADKEESAKTEQTSEAEEDPLPNNSSKTDEGQNSSNDIITDQKDQDFSANPKTEKESEPIETSSKTDEGSNSSNDIITDKYDQDFSANSTDKKENPTTHTLSKNDPGSNSSNDIITDKSDQNFSAISLNKDSLISTLSEDNALSEDKKQAIILYTNSLEAYNDGQITKEELIAELKATSADSKISKEETQDILEGLIIGLDKDTHKVASLNPTDLANQIDSAAEQKAAPQVAGPEATVPEDFINTKVKEKLAEPGLTIEDFQNYMYELGEKYNLTDEDADRIYTENAEAIGALVTKAQEEKTNGDVLAVTSGFANKTFRLTTNMNVLSMPLWSIPSGWYFDINVGPYLYLDTKPNDLVVNGLTVATAQYYPATNTIRYTFIKPVYNTTSIPINQDFKFNTEAIGNKNPIYVDINVRPKNNPAQTQRYTVYAESSRNPSESNNIYKSEIVLKQGEFTKTYGTHISRDEGNNIRYSYVPSKSIMNSYELAYRDMRNNDPDLSYYVLLKANPGDGSFTSDSTIDIGLLDGKKIRDLDVYSIPSTKLEGLRQSFVDGQVKEYLGSNFNPQQTNYGMDTSNIQVNLSSSQLNNSNSAYLIKVRAKDATDGQTFNFKYRWTGGDVSIDNYNNPYTISLSSPTISKDNSIGSSYIRAQIYPLGFDSNKFSAFEIRDISHGFSPIGFCIDARTHPPDNDAVYAGERLVINDLNDFEEFVKSSPSNIGRNTTVLTGNLRKVYEDLSIIYYLAESGQLFSNGSKKPTSNTESMAMQSLIYRALDGRIGKLSAPNYLSNDSTEKNYNESWWLRGNMWGASNMPSRAQVTSKANQFDQKVLNERNKGQANIKLITDSTTLYFYNNLKSSKATGTKYQSIMTGKITNKPAPDIKLTKVNKDTGSKLSNVKFILYKGNSTTPYDDGKGIIKISNSNGEFGWTNLEDGSYSVIEVEAPQGYEPVNNQKVASFKVSNGTIINKSIADGYNRNGNIANKSYTPSTSEFKFMKVNSTTNSPLAGAQFILENKTWGGADVRSNETLSDGIVRFKDIPDGTYILKETKRPNDADGKTYNEVPLDEDLATISFADGTYKISNASESFKQLNNRITVTNAPDRYRGSFTIYKSKIDENGRGSFANVTFTLKQTGGPSQTSPKTATTEANGIATFSGLEQDTTWELTENTPSEYIDYGYKWNVRVNDGSVDITPASEAARNSSLSTIENGDVPRINVFNRKKIKLRVKKVDSTDESISLAGVELGLYKNASDTTPYKKATTNSNGIAEFTDLPYGENYYVKEIKGIEGYDAKLVDMTNGSSVDSVKVDTSYRYIITEKAIEPEASFQSSGVLPKYRPVNHGVYTKVSTTTNEIETRILLETASDEERFKLSNYSTSSVSIAGSSYTINELNYNQFNNFKNSIANSEDKFVKVSDSINTQSSPFEYGINFAKQDNNMRFFVIDIKAINYNDQRPQPGSTDKVVAKYKLNVSTRNGLYNGAVDVTTNIDFTNNPTEPTITVGNKPGNTNGEFTIIKTDGSRNLTGATFSLFKDGRRIQSFKTGTDGRVSFTNLEPGSYVLEETQSPDGYMGVREKYDVLVESNGNVKIGKASGSADSRTSLVASSPIQTFAARSMDYTSYSNDLGVVTEATAPAEVNYLHQELEENKINKDQFEMKLKTIVDSLDMPKSEFKTIAEPSLAESSFYKDSNELASNVYSLNSTNLADKNISTMVASAYQGGLVSPTAVDWSGVLDNLNSTVPGTSYKTVENFVTIADGFVPEGAKVTDVKIGDTDFKNASRENRPIVFRSENGETLFCIDLNVKNPTGSSVKNTRHTDATSIPAANGLREVNQAQLEEIKKVFYYQQEIAREYGLDIINNDQDKIDLYSAIQANIFGILNGSASGFERYLNGDTVQSPTGVSERGKLLARALNKKTTVAVGWVEYNLKDAVTITYYIPNGKYQRTITAHVDNPVEFEKINLNGQRLEGATFEVIDKSTNTVAKDYKTGQEVRFTSKDYAHKAFLKDGSYILREVSAPEGYARIDDIHFRVETTVSHEKSSGIIQLKYPWDDKQPSKVTEYRRSRIIIESNSDLVRQDKIDNAKVYIANTTRENPKANIEFVKAGETDYKFLAGVEFELLKDGSVIQSAISNANGLFGFYRLEDGNYEVREKSNPNKDYEGNANKIVARFKVTDGQVENGISINGSRSVKVLSTGQFIITNDYSAPKTDIEFVKKDIETKSNLSSGSFYIDKLNETSQSYQKLGKSQSPGWGARLNFKDLVDGHYRLVEEIAPEGYELPTNRVLANFEIEDGKVASVTYNGMGATEKGSYEVYNRKIREITGGFKLGKADQFGSPIANVSFTLYETDANGAPTQFIETKSTDANGEIEFTKLPASKTYVLKETRTPEGYEPLNEAYTVSLDSNGMPSFDKNVSLGTNGSFEIINIENRINFKKVDEETNESLANVKFNLSRDGTTVSTQTTDRSGNMSFANLADGSYSLVESENPNEGYDLPSGPLATWTIKNGRIENILVHGIKADRPQTSKETTFANGKLSVTNVKIDDKPYILKNKKEEEKTSISFLKVDSETSKALSGAMLRLWDDTRGVYVAPDGTSDTLIRTDGTAFTFTDIRDGKYYLDEYKAAEGYVNAGEGIGSFEVVDGKITNLVVNSEKLGPYDGSVIKVKNDKEPERAQFTIKKSLLSTSGNTKPYESLYKVKFTLYYYDEAENSYINYYPDEDFTGYQNPRSVTVGDDGIGTLTFDRLEVGRTYYLAETDSNPLYKRKNVVWTVEVDKKGQVTITPVELDPKNGESTRVDGLFKEIPNRILFIKEDDKGNRLPVAPKGWKELENSGIVVENAYQDAAKFELYKQNMFGEYELYEDSEAKRMDFDRTDDFLGLFGWSDLPNGSYKVKEVKAPEGYKVDKTVNDSYKTDTNYSEYQSDLENDFVARFEIVGNQRQVKTDSVKSYTGRIAYDYENEIITVKGDTIEENESNHPIISVSNEVLPPVVVTNIPDETETKIKLKKVDESNDTGLEGAKFKISENFNIINAQENESTNEEADYQDSDTSGYLTFDNLKAGQSYYIKEVAAPTGYILSGQIMKITFDAEGNLIKNESYVVDKDGNKSSENPMYEVVDEEGSLIIKIKNRKPTYPATGGSGTTLAFAIIGTAIMILGIAYYGIYNNGKKRRRSR